MPPAYGGKISREATPTAGKISGEATRTVIEALMVHLLWLFLRESFPSVTIIKGTTLPSVTIILRQCDVEGELAFYRVVQMNPSGGLRQFRESLSVQHARRIFPRLSEHGACLLLALYSRYA